MCAHYVVKQQYYDYECVNIVFPFDVIFQLYKYFRINLNTNIYGLILT